MPSKFDPDKHHRQSIRLKGWDYTTPGGYFITICTHQRQNLFDNDVFREVAENAWRNIPTQPHAGHVALDESVVMPNHLHGILMLAEAGPDGEHKAGMTDRRGEADTAVRRGEATRIDDLWINNLCSELPRPYPKAATPNELPHPASPQPHGVKPGSVGAIVGNFKSLVTRRVNNIHRSPGSKLWQRGYYDRIVRNDRELGAIREYIWQNPQRWAEDRDNLDGLLARMRLVLED